MSPCLRDVCAMRLWYFLHVSLPNVKSFFTMYTRVYTQMHTQGLIQKFVGGGGVRVLEKAGP